MTTLATRRPAFTPAEAAALARTYFGIDAPARALDGERDSNFALAGVDGEFVLKIANPAEAPAVLEMQNSALQHLARVAPELPVPRLVATPDGATTQTVARNDTEYLLRCVTLLPGSVAGQPFSTGIERTQLGALLARTGIGLRGFFDPAARRELAWDLQQAPALRRWTRYIDDTRLRAEVRVVLDEFERDVGPALPALRAQVIHNDANPDNLIVAGGRLAGLIDFGDIVHAPLICDLAVACAYQLGEDPVASITPVIAAYHNVTALEPDEIELLPGLIATRLAATITVSSWRAREHADNRAYIETSQRYAIGALARLRAMPRAQILARLRSACGRYAPATSPAPATPATLAARRARALGPLYRLFYDEPVQLVRGEGAWVFDADGRRYLDAYNNVACVGHCHPRVLAALEYQARQINTHSRYLHENIVTYAERLAGLLPFDDPVCMFCCTGSEANELAYRIACAHGGARGVVVTDHAYHGNTFVTAQMSTADTPPERREPFVATIEAPDSYRGARRCGAPGLAEHYASRVDSAIAALATRGIEPAALLVDTIFSCDGIVTAPPGFLSDAASRMRAAGGLVIADEVQAGFARTGEAFWGFERHGIVPDIVTLGKPMGNGHPLAGVVCERATVEAFAAGCDYFNTFGGNPVSCAVGLAVLDVLHDENLQANALGTGAYLREGLQELARTRALIGDVRGAGLFTGVELVADRTTLEPAREQAHAIVNDLRRRGVLLSATGPRANVLKIRPPLVFTRAQADLLLEHFESALTELA